MTLGLIATRPAVRAGDLAASVVRDVAPSKLDVRKLKALGLTISLEVGYRLSPLGPALPRPDVPRPGLLTRRPGRADRATGSCDRAVGRYPVGMALGTEAPDSTSTDTEVDTPTEPVFSITEAALAKVSEIRAAYHRLARALHPDHHPNADASERRELERKFGALHAAYRRLAPPLRP